MEYLLEGIAVPIQENSETKYKTVKIIDFDNIHNNTFKAINQYTIIEHSEKRPDIIIFINGLPLVVVELKSTVREDVKLIDGGKLANIAPTVLKMLEIEKPQTMIDPLF